jgi:hypothetical protein
VACGNLPWSARGSASRSLRRSFSDVRFRRSDLVLSARRTLATVDAAMARAIWGGVPQRNKNFTGPNTATVRDVLRRGHPCRGWSLIFDTPARGSRTIRATART